MKKSESERKKEEMKVFVERKKKEELWGMWRDVGDEENEEEKKKKRLLTVGWKKWKGGNAPDG